MLHVKSVIRSLTVAIAVLGLLAFGASAAVVKTQVNSITNAPVIDASGGPDGFGYRWIDNNNEPTGPTYNWVDISTTGTAMTINLGTTDDGIFTPIPIGFNFPFYGVNRTYLVCNTNGHISFDTSYALSAYTNAQIPTTEYVGLNLAPFWDDLISTNVRYATVEGNLVISYIGSTLYNPTTAVFTFQVILSPNGNIVYQYNTVDATNASSCTVGIQNDDGTVGLNVVNDAAYVAVNKAVRITAPVIANVLYGTVTSAATSTPISGANVSYGAFSAVTNAAGYYRMACLAGTASFVVTKAGYNTRTENVTISTDSLAHNVTLTRPVGGATPTSIEMNVTVPDSVSATLTLRNTGDGPMTWSASINAVGADMTQPAHIPWTGETVSEANPHVSQLTTAIDEIDTTWQVLRDWQIDPVTGRASNLAGEYVDGGYVIVSCANMFFRLNANTGALVDSFTIAGAPVTSFTVRDMAYDGSYIYGGWDGTLRAFDPTNGTAVAAANIPLAACASLGGVPRGVAYDPDTDNFFVANWASPIYQINRSGVVVRTITNSLQVYGMAWYGNDPDGAQLYTFSQDSAAGSQSVTAICKYDVTTSAMSVVRLSIPGVVPLAGSSQMAGGCFITDQMVPGYVTFTGLVQTTPDRMITCELGSSFTRWSLDMRSGTLAANQTVPLNVLYRSIRETRTTVNAQLQITWGAADEVINVPIIVNVVVAAPEATNVVPTVHKLIGAYPNPFNPTTSIRFTMATRGEVKLEMYDLMGRCISTLFDGAMPAGTHAVSFKANDLPAGTYFVRMTAGSYTDVTKVVLLK